ncbi:unnamed protein product, partial [Nesidiocoris tenuis]
MKFDRNGDNRITTRFQEERKSPYSEELCKFCTWIHFSIAKTNLTYDIISGSNKIKRCAAIIRLVPIKIGLSCIYQGDKKELFSRYEERNLTLADTELRKGSVHSSVVVSYSNPQSDPLIKANVHDRRSLLELASRECGTVLCTISSRQCRRRTDTKFPSVHTVLQRFPHVAHFFNCERIQS